MNSMDTLKHFPYSKHYSTTSRKNSRVASTVRHFVFLIQKFKKKVYSIKVEVGGIFFYLCMGYVLYYIKCCRQVKNMRPISFESLDLILNTTKHIE